jgi:acetyl esterase/lipase
MRRRDLIAAVSALVAAPAAFAQNAGPLTVRYARAPGVAADLQSLDVYGAAAGQARPIMAFIHGGGWAFGDKANPQQGRDKAAAFTRRGFVYATLNYRLSPAAKHPEHVQDVAAAIAWLHKNASTIGGDPNRLYVMGHSAGAHLAALVATDERRLAAHGLPLSAIRGVVPLDGAGYDLTVEAPLAISQGGMLGLWYRDAFGGDPAGWADASPLSHVAPGKAIPPFLLVHAARPDAVTQSRALAKALRAAGVQAETLLTPKQGHNQINRQFGRAGDMVTQHVMAQLAAWGA